MISKAETLTKIIPHGDNTIVVSGVKGDKNLFRVVINSTFIGYLERHADGELYKVHGSKITAEQYDEICKALKT